MTARWRFAALSLAVVVAACASDDGDSDEDGDAATAVTSVEATPATTATTTAASTTEASTAEAVESSTTEETAPATTEAVAADISWEQVVPGGDCQCSDGSEFSFYVREADPERVVLFFQGGGACFSAETCAVESGTYKATTGPDDDPDRLGGIFDFSSPDNPLADHSFVYVPYCTGDVHLGTATTEYAPGLTIHHKGYVNGTAALEKLVATFPAATEVVVTGESAGSIPSPVYAGLVSDALPDAEITVLADGSGGYTDVPALNAALSAFWGTVIPPWPENAGLTPEQWGFLSFFVQAGRHDPAIVFARHDYAFDEVQTFFSGLTGSPTDNLLAVVDANEQQIESTGTNLLSYIAPGSEHTVLSRDEFYREGVEGTSLSEWVTSLIAGEPVADVHCTECRLD